MDAKSARLASLQGRIGAALFCGALFCGATACGGGEDSMDLGAGTLNRPAPRGRPYPCPPEAPESGAICSTRDLSCEYSAGTCVCASAATGPFGELAWNCPFAPETSTCPKEEPQAGSACTSLVLGSPECSYGRQVTCHCAGEAQAWACWDPGDCPKEYPQADSECDPVGMMCTYQAATCECFSSGWRCPEAN